MAAVIDQLKSAVADDRVAIVAAVDRAPLSLSQLHHWRLLKSGELPTSRQVAAATRIQGKFNAGAFRKSLAEVVRRHAALRTLIADSDDVPTQIVSAEVRIRLDVHDLTGLAPELRAAEQERVIADLIVSPTDHSADPLFGAALLKYADNERILILAMDHLISDAASMNVLMRELFTAYGQAVRGEPFSLPMVDAQFIDYAIWQRNAEESWLQNGGTAWHERLTACGEAVIVFQSNGRVDDKYSQGIGYFASPLFLRISLVGTDFDSLLARVTQEYCTASEHIHFPYISARQQQSGFTRNTTFNWIPLAHRMQPVLDASETLITCSEFKFENPVSKVLLRHERQPIALFMEQEDSIGGKLSFPMRWYTVRSMQQLAAYLIHVLQIMLEQPNVRVSSIKANSGQMSRQ
jgi:hypothetical protein